MGCTRMLITQNKHKNNQRAITLKQRNRKQTLLYVTHCLDQILIPVMLREDTTNGYLVMGCTRLFRNK